MTDPIGAAHDQFVANLTEHLDLDAGLSEIIGQSDS